MNKSQELLALLPQEESNYDKVVMSLDVIPSSKAPKGLDELVTLIAQTLNGGIEQYVSNDYESELPAALSFLKQLGPVAKEAAAMLTKLKPEIDHFVDVYRSDYSDDDYESAADDLEIWDDWLYANNRSEALMGEVLAFLKKAKLLPEGFAEATIGGRQLASSSDKAKYAGISKQLADIDAKKKGYHDTISKEADDAKRATAQKALHDIRDKEQALLKVRKDMLSKFRGLRSKN